MTAVSGSVVCKPPSRLEHALAVLALAGLIALLHARCIPDGLFMDDHAHFRQLRECDWSLAGLTAACRLELIGNVLEVWWMPDVVLRFFRPVAFGIMKATYTLAGWDPAWMHVASLVWHLLACTLLMTLLRRLSFGPWLSWGVAALFAMHPGHIATVQWIACQTELMVTSFLLAGTLCWGRFRGWPGFRGAASAASPGTLPVTAARAASAAGANAGWVLASLLCFALALGCRENAVMFPFVIASLEPFVWRRNRRRALLAYAAFGAVLVGYLVVRSTMLGGAALPPKPYVIPPGDPEFVRFVADKSLYYLLGEFLLLPIVPFGGQTYLVDHPIGFYCSAAAIAITLLGVVILGRRRPAAILGPVWLLAYMAPVLPSFASPHHLYLPGIGWAIVCAFLLQSIRGFSESADRVAVVRRRVCAVCVLLLGGVFGTCTHFFDLAYDCAQRVEDRVVEEVIHSPRGVHDGDMLYFVNLPIIAHYVRLAVEERTGVRGLRAVALTWAPRILGPATSCELTWEDPRTALVRIDHDRWFSGPLGEMVEQATGRSLPQQTPASTARHTLEVEMLDHDSDGVFAYRFRFAEPPTSGRAHFYWGSRVRWAFDCPPPVAE